MEAILLFSPSPVSASFVAFSFPPSLYSSLLFFNPLPSTDSFSFILFFCFCFSCFCPSLPAISYTSSPCPATSYLVLPLSMSELALLFASSMAPSEWPSMGQIQPVCSSLEIPVLENFILTKLFPIFQVLKNHGQNFLVGNTMTRADIQLLETILMVEEVKADSLSKFPLLKVNNLSPKHRLRVGHDSSCCMFSWAISCFPAT